MQAKSKYVRLPSHFFVTRKDDYGCGRLPTIPFQESVANFKRSGGITVFQASHAVANSASQTISKSVGSPSPTKVFAPSTLEPASLGIAKTTSCGSRKP